MRRLHGRVAGFFALVHRCGLCEYVTKKDYEAGTSFVGASHNVIMNADVFFQGLRVGRDSDRLGVLSKASRKWLNRVRAPFNVNIAAPEGRVAALHDREFVEKVLRHNETWRAWLIGEISQLSNAGVQRVDDSVANFVLLHFGRCETHHFEADRFLMSRGIIMRGCASYGLPQCLRLTVGQRRGEQSGHRKRSRNSLRHER